jgi:uncharacterized membrane protein YdjX (TVP38/TMEM64 family)
MNQEYLKKFAPLALLLAGGVLIVLLWQPITALFSDLDALRAQIARLGAWGPVALIALSVVQVLVAPLPGYPIVFVAGLLYGTWWGAIYANIGLLLSGMLAMGLTRRFGRPVAERFVESGRLKRLERLFSSNSIWLWFIILLVPTGDYPYFAAGLSRVSFRNFFIALCLARLPFTFVLTNAAERATELPQETTLLLAGILIVIVGLAYWQQERISAWVEKWLERLNPHPLEHE